MLQKGKVLFLAAGSPFHVLRFHAQLRDQQVGALAVQRIDEVLAAVTALDRLFDAAHIAVAAKQGQPLLAGLDAPPFAAMLLTPEKPPNLV